MITASKKEMEAAFTEWERRWRTEPERFQTDMQRLAGTSESYGESAAAYLSEILREQQKRRIEKHDLRSALFVGAAIVVTLGMAAIVATLGFP